MAANKPEHDDAFHKTVFNNPDFARVYKTAEAMTGTYALDMLHQMDLASYAEPVNFLDLACGTGIVTKHAVDILGNANPTTKPLLEDQFTFADFAPPMLNVLRSRFQTETWPIHDGQIEVVEADMRDTKLASDTYTHLGCNFGPCNAPNPEKVFRESYRVLKAGGIGGWSAWQTLGWLPDQSKAFNNVRSAAAQKCADGTATEQDQKLSKMPAIMQEYEFIARLAGHDIPKMRGEGVKESDLPRWDHKDYLKSQIEVAGFSDVKVEVVSKDFVMTTEDCETMIPQMINLMCIFWTQEEKETLEGAGLREKVKQWWTRRLEEDDVQDGKLIWRNFRAMIATGRKAG